MPRGRPPKYPKRSLTPEPPITPKSRRSGRASRNDTSLVDSSFIDEDIADEPKKKRKSEDDEDDEYTGEEEGDEGADKEGDDDVEGEVDEDGEGEEEEEEEDEEGDGEGEVEGDDTGAEAEGSTPAINGEDKKKKPLPKKRGRKKIKLTEVDDGFVDDEGNQLNVVDDEIVMDNEDPKGQEKVDKNGNLIGDRVYRMKTFTLLGHGEQLYMVSTEPARLVGFRDSYLLFKTHKWLFKKVCTHEEKMDLINRHIIPNSYKGRSVNLVTARSIFREFGARIIKDGRKITDDFWEQRARDRGDVEGEYADPAELYMTKYMTSGLGLGGANQDNGGSGTPPVANSAALASSALVKYQTDQTWMYQIVMQTLGYNRRLQDDRSLGFRGIKDTYTGLNFYPQTTQSTTAIHKKVSEEPKEKIISDVVYYNQDIRKRATGLKDVPLEIFDDLDDPEIKKAILEQQAYERGYKPV
ncbi:chromatin structure-remodeling complex subunit RSC7 [[Candida] railenensis]|uniref:Chromatin structure-remodeling complex subunit RSC7 n=1 Tax=[Candida] railenensis TaxID=45579 RepID=A0A9P0VWR3_9ASCO|nr:chromatin structure-remodeling complex subunit RSC7 [[Candida] railenensis]